jgi:RNA polymerase sigma-70 factor (ECF subfamily)
MPDNENTFDEGALELLYRKLEKPLYNVVYRWVWDGAEARDILQETFLRLWKMQARVRPETVEPLAYKIALNLARKRLRRKKILSWVGLEGRPPPPSEQPDPEETMRQEERDETVRAAVESLAPKYRDVILLSEFSELTYDEIAAALDIQPGTVASRRHTAIKMLRDKLEGWSPREDA